MQILKPEEIRKELTRLKSPVDKTAGDQERRAFDFLRDYIENALSQPKKKKKRYYVRRSVKKKIAA